MLTIGTAESVEWRTYGLNFLFALESGGFALSAEDGEDAKRDPRRISRSFVPEIPEIGN